MSGGAESTSKLKEQSSVAGFTPEMVAALLEAQTNENEEYDDCVYKDNAHIVNAFLIVATQWRFGSMGSAMGAMAAVRMGFDYGSCFPMWKVYGIDVTTDLLDGLRVIEYEILRLEMKT